MPSMPVQKPTESRQDYQTPQGLLTAVKRRLNIEDFSVDLAADRFNRVTERFISEEEDALSIAWNHEGWGWCNPPFGLCGDFACKAVVSRNQANTALLIPASTGANYWEDFIHYKSRVLLMKGRITFVGEVDPYPKDLVLVLFGRGIEHGYEVWDWRKQR